jgi:hypothetical protein
MGLGPMGLNLQMDLNGSFSAELLSALQKTNLICLISQPFPSKKDNKI